MRSSAFQFKDAVAPFLTHCHGHAVQSRDRASTTMNLSSTVQATPALARWFLHIAKPLHCIHFVHQPPAIRPAFPGLEMCGCYCHQHHISSNTSSTTSSSSRCTTGARTAPPPPPPATATARAPSASATTWKDRARALTVVGSWCLCLCLCGVWVGEGVRNMYNTISSTYIISSKIRYSTSSTAQGGGGGFKKRKTIGEIDCCESGMSEQTS